MSKKAVGYIKYTASGETIKYDNAEALIADYKAALDCMGINAAVADTYTENLELKYKLSKIIHNEFGIELPKKQFIINATTPEFKLKDKLKVIYEAEHGKKHRITKPYENTYIILNDGVLNNLSVKAIKNLVDRHYNAVLKHQGKQKIKNRNKSKYERT